MFAKWPFLKIRDMQRMEWDVLTVGLRIVDEVVLHLHCVNSNEHVWANLLIEISNHLDEKGVEYFGRTLWLHRTFAIKAPLRQFCWNTT